MDEWTRLQKWCSFIIKGHKWNKIWCMAIGQYSRHANICAGNSENLEPRQGRVKMLQLLQLTYSECLRMSG